MSTQHETGREGTTAQPESFTYWRLPDGRGTVVRLPDEWGPEGPTKDQVTAVVRKIAMLTPAEVEQATPEKPQTERLTANLPMDAAADLRAAAAATGFNKLTTLSRAIRVFAELVRIDRAGGKVTIEEADGTRTRLLLR
jgi:hypothetical protein